MKEKLGTISLSPDILDKANIGLWAFELDEGKEPRMYVDDAMLRLIGLDHQISPEETYHDWYDFIDKDSYSLVEDAVNKMIKGEHAEVQYPWHNPNGDILIVRCGGVRNYQYTKGIRIEGTHQDVTKVSHLDVEQRRIEKENLLNYFVNEYDSAYFINLKDDTFEVLHMNSELLKKFGVGGNSKDIMINFINEHIHPDDRELMLEIIDKKFVKKVLKSDKSFTFIAREIFDGVEKTLRGQIIRGADVNHVAVGFMDVTKDVLEQQKRLLGAIQLSPDILTKANIGLWAFELDEGKEPRMYVDEAMLGLIGLDHQISPEDTYHAWYDYIDKDSYGLVADAVEKMTNGEHAEVQYPWHFKDGRTVIVRCGGVRNFEYRKGIRIEGTHQDVTQTLHFDEEERKRYEEQKKTIAELQFRAAALDVVVKNDSNIELLMDFFCNQLIIMTGCDQVIFRNENEDRIIRNAFGVEEVSPETCIDCPFKNFLDDYYDEDGYLVVEDCYKDYKGLKVSPSCPVKSFLMQRIYIDGKPIGRLTIHFIKNHHVFTDEDKNIVSTVGKYLGLFITRIKSKKAELEMIEVQSSSKAKTEFLFNMSHDIRTPMNAILGFTDVAMNHINDIKKVSDSLNKIKSSGTHLLNLINDILEMSRIEAGRLELNIAPLNMIDAIKKVDIMSQSLAISKSINYKSDFSNIKNKYIFADELHINQVVVNLISNAVKYTNPGGSVKYTVEEISEPTDGIAYYRFIIEDNGIGMSEEFQKHLFESFSREISVSVGKQEGAGLGLAIVKRIVDLANGKIFVESKKGVGSKFIIELPFKLMSKEEISEFIKDNSIDLVDKSLKFKEKKVLLVEDNELNREIATEILSEAGLIIESAEDGEIAVKKVKEKGLDYFDFILMDIQMPIMNGYEATKAIRSLPDGQDVLIIALSANAFEEDVKKSIAYGMNAHVAKPIDVNTLFNTMELLMDKK